VSLAAGDLRLVLLRNKNIFRLEIAMNGFFIVLSEYFYAAYTNGSLEDNGNHDFALWAGSYEVKLDRQEAYRNMVMVKSSSQAYPS
jgi:hypothetical protein